jgi:phage I-like protein
MGSYKMSDSIIMAGRYDHIDFSIPDGVKAEAEKGLAWRKKFKRGGTSVGLATARTLVSGGNVSPEKARHIARYFPRHEVDKQGKGYSPGEDGFPSNGRIAWALWGGDAGRAWSSKLVRQMESADEKNMSEKKVKADLGVADVHADGPMKVRRMKPLDTEARKALPTEAFALPEKRAYPIHDASHARNAMARLEQQKQSMPEAEYKTAKRNILKAYKKFGIKHEGEIVSTGKGRGRPLSKRGFAFKYMRNGVSIDVRHLADREVRCEGVEIDRTALLDDSVNDNAPKLVWNQLAKVGTFRGHPSGPFELTPQIFGEIVANFRATKNLRIPIDFEHASEQDPTQGSIPHSGAPAQGWILDLDNRGSAGLWGLVEWLEPARSYVRDGKYKFFSPAIRFGAKDRVTGQPSGAKMTSGALTNNPFLDGMAPLAASDRLPTEETINMGDYVHSLAEVMPVLRSCLFEPGSHQCTHATMAEVHDAICRLEQLVDEFRAINPQGELMSAKHAGVDLGASLTRLRDVMKMDMRATVSDMLEFIRDMIGDALGISDSEDEEDDDLEPASSRDMRDGTMAEKSIELRDAETKVATLMSERDALASKNATLELQLKERDGKLNALESEVITLRNDAKTRAENDEKRTVNVAFETYKDSHKLTDAHKVSMLLTLRHDPETFHKLYPEVAPANRHLMRDHGNRQSPALQSNLTQQNASTAPNGGGTPPADFAQAHFELTNRLMSDKNMPLEQATVEARRQLMRPTPVTT